LHGRAMGRHNILLLRCQLISSPIHTSVLPQYLHLIVASRY